MIHRARETAASQRQPARSTAQSMFKRNAATVLGIMRRNDEYQYAGAADALVECGDGGLVLVDFKTSNRLWPSYGLQVAALSMHPHPGALTMCVQHVPSYVERMRTQRLA